MKQNLTFSQDSGPARVWRRTGAVLVLAALCGCMVGPDYHRSPALPKDEVPKAFGDPAVTNTEWKAASPSAHLPRGAWWECFGDAELNRLETLATTNNQNIVAAMANLAQARAAINVARADLLPQASASTSMVRQRTSANTSPTSAAAGRSRTFDFFAASADATWELDLWGRIRRQMEGAKARYIASADDLESSRLSIQAEVAVDYFTLRAYEAQLALLNSTVTAYDRALELTQKRHDNGIATELDVAEAETQLKSARAQIPAVQLQSAQTRHALAVLCGQPATTFALTLNTAAATNLPAIPVSAPSEWLESRPDIAAAERRMAAANADVGVARAAFYPRVIINASGGYESIDVATLFNWPSHVWALGPSIQIPLFTGGRSKAQLASIKSAYEASIATYRQTVLAAFQDVEDQLAAQSLLARQIEEERGALAAARRALDISNQRYKAGVEQYLDVITAQTAVLTHELSVAQLSGQRLVAGVRLIKALGAGWQVPAGAETARQ